jgi:hypothetical protein
MFTCSIKKVDSLMINIDCLGGGGIRGKEAERNLPNVTTKKISERILIYYNFYIFPPFRLLYSIFPPVLREFLLFIFIISQYCPTGLVCPTIWGEAAGPSAPPSRPLCPVLIMKKFKSLKHIF